MADSGQSITFTGPISDQAGIVIGNAQGNAKVGGIHYGNISGKNNVGGNKTEIQESVEGLTRVVETLFGQQLKEGQIKFFEQHLQKSTTMNGVDDWLLTSLPALNKIQKAVCMIQINTDEWGTGFLCNIPGTGITFCSAGHNFEDILNKHAPSDSLKDFIVHFGNIDGNLPPLEVGSPPMKDRPMNLKEFLDCFNNVCGSISFNGKRILIKNGNVVDYGHRNEVIEKAEDYCVLLLDDTNVNGILNNLGLHSILCGQGNYLKYKNEGLVAIFGHPQIPEDGKVPFRMSFGAEKDPEKIKDFFDGSNPLIKLMAMSNPSGDKTKMAKNYIFYDKDTKPGNSGSPVIGRGDKNLNQGYCIKGIHVKSFNNEDTNGAQNIEKIIDWINLGRLC